jgi:alpha-beta hydrolase superfamily lysophospholipase
MLKWTAIILGIIVVLLAAAWAKLRGPDIPYETLEAKYTNGASRFIDLSGGFHVHYQDDGDPTLPILVLLRGFGDSYTSWEGWAQQLRTSFHLLSVDFPGHGLTRAPARRERRADRACQRR